LTKQQNSKKGMAIVIVLVFCIAILGFLTVLLFNTRSQRGTHESQYDQVRALMAARSATQMAIYKYRVLPSEFYKIHKLELQVRSGISSAADVAVLNQAKTFWLEDLTTEFAGSPAIRVKTQLDAAGGGNHQFAVEEFGLVSRTNQGYIKDYLKIRAWGSFNGTRKIIEELIEVKIAS